MKEKIKENLIIVIFFTALILLAHTFASKCVEYDKINNSELRQLTKDKLRLEIQLLKIQIEQNEINLQKEY